MSKKVLRYVIDFIIIFALAFLLFDASKRYLTSPQPLMQTESTNLTPNYNLEALQQEVAKQGQQIAELSQELSTLNQVGANSEKYSKILFVLSNLHTSLLNRDKLNIEFEIQTLLKLTQTDLELAKIFLPLMHTEEVYGIKYFERQFNSISRSVIAKYFENDNDTKALSFAKKHFLPYFTYISPSGSHVSQTLNEARLHLKSGNMLEFYNTMQAINSKSKAFEKYFERLENFIKVWNALEQSKTHIQIYLFQEKQG